MTVDTWKRMEDVFLSIVDLPLDEQQRLLDAQCASDERLKEMVEAMLAADRKNGRGIQAAVEGEVARLFESPLPAERLGSYRIEREIGRGGMGAVYLATRDDQQFDKRVAIKVMKRGTDTAEALARFRDERQILAQLDHPYIARLLDAGTTPDGRPFFVMEYIEGQPVDVFCRDRALDVKARCRLFLKICEAVSYAHRNLVVHRDLKPANILITADESPKLLDFGVAKLLDRPSAQTAPPFVRPLTPEYASPEQVHGIRITTASDVYSLGAVLYELLTGRRAQSIPGGASVREIERVVCESEPASPRSIAPDLDPDLSNIVLAAMRKEPELRYPSADQFAEDVRRYLKSLPVLARKHSLWYRFTKLVRRERYTLGACAAIGASLVCGTLIAFSQAREAKAARRAAELNRDVAIRERQRSEERLAQMVHLSNRSLSEVYALMERLPGGLAARQELVRTTLTFLEELSKDAGGNPKLQFALATAYSKLGDVQGDDVDTSNVGDMAGAVRSYRAAAALLGDPAADADRLVLWAELQDKIGKTLPDTGDRDGAQQVLRQAIAMVETSRLLTPAKAERLRARLYLSLSRATIDLPRTLALARQSLSAAERDALLSPGDPAAQLLLSTARTQTGFTHHLMGNPRAAQPFYFGGMQIRERLVREHPGDLIYRRALKLAYEHYAALLADPDRANLGRPDLARVYYEKARPLEESGAADSQNSLAKFDYAVFLLDSAKIAGTPEEMERSLGQFRSARAILADLVRAEPGIVRYSRALSSSYEFLGRRLSQMARDDEALAEYRQALAVTENLLAAHGADATIMGDAFNLELRMAVLFQKLGECDRAVEFANRILNPRSPETGRAIVNQAEAVRNACTCKK